MSDNPMLAAKFDPKNVRELSIVKSHLPLLASFKLDGVRAMTTTNGLLSRTLKPIPNYHTRCAFADPSCIGLDGELIVGSPTDPRCYRSTVSAVMSCDGTPDVRFFVFDNTRADAPTKFLDRINALYKRMSKLPKNVVLLEQRLCQTWDDVLDYEEEALDFGYEGLVLRAPGGPYKHGRSTLKEGYAIKLKRFVDGEAVIVGMTELMHNDNEATVSETGHTKRSSCKDGKRPGGTMGNLIVRDVRTEAEFEIGTGFTTKDRDAWWRLGEKANGMTIVYKSFHVGAYDKPRHPVYKGLRCNIDL